ncbi:hypothetical protein CHH86_14305 [Bacillus paralicheniformis]|uniref:Uncharacterized protein n=1 Tax=Bacillus swezeyi TaxID=1925020 RepID=A0A5M8RHR0_9BACI|nr:hypothetical protein DX927_23375 [Bacillus swezeyi]KAA6471556.1 hypothetical protein DX928_23615 [Bacillus swezeyi]PAC96516.1 hypothetical protein CHH86_14305 [Bacillus paralicheniformis]
MFLCVLNGDYLSWNAIQRLCVKALNIQYGNGVLIVVRDRESLSHGEGEQFICLSQNWKGA